jgi:myo-inositol-1(or 4)-monophosphatase
MEPRDNVEGAAPPVDELGALALAAARAGADAIEQMQVAEGVQVDHKTASHDLVTTADRASEAAILRVLRGARPNDAVLAEESGRQAGTSRVRWLVDPLDGTANFVYNRSDYAVSVAAEHDGVLLAGAIVRPADGRWVLAAGRELHGSHEVRPRPGIRAATSAAEADTGKPASRTPTIRRPAHLSESLVSFGFPYSLADRQRSLALVAALVPYIRGLRVIGSAACDFLALVHGESDAACTIGLAEWDTAAGQAAVVAAGGAWERIITPAGLPVLIAGSQDVVNSLLAVIRGTPPDTDRGLSSHVDARLEEK